MSSPDPSLALDEYLLSKYDSRDRKSHSLWQEIPTQEFRRTWRVMNFNRRSRAAWEREGGGALKGGEAVIISVVGHVVRIQEVAASGLVIDDPFGELRLHKSKPTDNNNYSFGAENPYKGDGARPDEEPAGGHAGDNVASNWKAVTEYTWLAPYAIG